MVEVGSGDDASGDITVDFTSVVFNLAKAGRQS